ncbi:MAG: transposase [Firmicutes bacterium]|nr:transposase [Bacillota bacterium]
MGCSSNRLTCKAWKKVVAWFGYKLQLLVEATYEWPVAWTVTKASTADITEAPTLLAPLHEKHPLAWQAARVLSADRGYDATAFVASLWDDDGIKPVIDIRNLWKDGEATRLVPGYDTVTDNYRGDVFCHHPETGTAHPMAPGGFEADRDTLKKRCPAKVSGIPGDAQATCPVAHGLRIPWDTDRRVFTPLDRRSYTWEREYAHRTAVARVNSRRDVSLGLERHTIRGMAKMRMRCGLAWLVMLGMALGRIQQQHPAHLRSLVRSA